MNRKVLFKTIFLLAYIERKKNFVLLKKDFLFIRISLESNYQNPGWSTFRFDFVNLLYIEVDPYWKDLLPPGRMWLIQNSAFVGLAIIFAMSMSRITFYNLNIDSGNLRLLYRLSAPIIHVCILFNIYTTRGVQLINGHFRKRCKIVFLHISLKQKLNLGLITIANHS